MSDTRRDQLIDFVEKEFIGPDPVDWPGMVQPNGEEILRSDPPLTRYIAGILYPREAREENIEFSEGDMLTQESDGEDAREIAPARKTSGDNQEFLEDAEELINRSNAYRQSAMSVTVSVKEHDSVHVEVKAGIYKKNKEVIDGKDKFFWLRSAIEWDNDGAAVLLPSQAEGICRLPVGDTGLQFDVTYRYRTGTDTMYTFTLENTKECRARVEENACFFHTKFIVHSEKGFSPLAERRKITRDEDYLSNQLLYRNVHNYAIGHGTAADWDDNEPVTWISTATFPRYDI